MILRATRLTKSCQHKLLVFFSKVPMKTCFCLFISNDKSAQENCQKHHFFKERDIHEGCLHQHYWTGIFWNQVYMTTNSCESQWSCRSICFRIELSPLAESGAAANPNLS
ncbi:unnamed protein product [Musa textilis]